MRRQARAFLKWGCRAIAFLIAGAYVLNIWGSVSWWGEGRWEVECYRGVLGANWGPGFFGTFPRPTGPKWDPRDALDEPFKWRLEVDCSPDKRARFVQVPLWLPLVLTAAPAAWMRRSDRLAAQRIKAGVCRACGYDRRGLAPSANCPECGAIPGST